jgi:hypothetical protein
MSDLFNLAAKRALQMSQPSPQKISINIEICQPSEGGLSSIQKGMDIGGEPHKLAYINSDESSLLKAIGGQGEPMEGTNGIPAYFGGAELLEQIRLKMAEDPKDTRRAMDVHLEDIYRMPEPIGIDPRRLLKKIYGREGAEERFKDTEFLARILRSYPEEEVTDEEGEVVVETV